MQVIAVAFALSSAFYAVSAAPVAWQFKESGHIHRPENFYFHGPHEGTQTHSNFNTVTRPVVASPAVTQTTTIAATSASTPEVAAASTPVGAPAPVIASGPSAAEQTTAPSVPAAVATPNTPVESASTTRSQTSESAAAIPSAAAQVPTTNSNIGTTNALTAETLTQIMPQSASCAGAPFPAECLTASQAALLLTNAFTKYSITSKPAQAAILALIALESGQLKYNKAHYGDIVAGKGTRNMQSPTFNLKYATDVLGAGAIAGKDAGTVLGLLVADEGLDVGSAAWFLATQCPGVLAQFATNPGAAWEAYLGPGCIGTTETADRDAYWVAAKKALGVSA